MIRVSGRRSAGIDADTVFELGARGEAPICSRFQSRFAARLHDADGCRRSRLISARYRRYLRTESPAFLS